MPMRAAGLQLAVLMATVIGAFGGVACLQPIEGTSDGGLDGSVTDAGSLDGGGQPDRQDGGADGGEPLDAGESDGGVDGGTPDAATGPITWGRMTGTFPSEVTAVSASSRSNAYVTDRHGAVHRYDGTGWSKVTQSPNNFGGEGIYVAPDGAVFVGGGDLAHCLTGCAAPGDFTWTTSPIQVTGVCGRDSNTVFATGINASNAGILLRFQRATGTWVNLGPTDTTFNGGCWVSEAGVVFIAAQAAIVRFANGIMTPEVIHFPDGMSQNDISFQRYEAIAGHGDAVFATGYRRGTLRRNAQGSWDYVVPPTGLNRYEGAAAFSPTDVVVVGRRSGDGRHLRQFDGTEWTVPSVLPDADLNGIHAVDDRTWFLVGSTSIDSGAVYLGTRP